MALFAAGLVLLLARAKPKLPLLMLLSLAVAYNYGPLVNDIMAGNIATLQFFFITFLAYVLEKGSFKASPTRFHATSILFMSSLAFFLLVKPNILFIAAALSASLWLTRGSKAFFTSSAVAAIIAGTLIAFPCLYYDSWSVWSDWYAYFSSVSSKNFYPVENGNVSTTLSLANLFGTRPGLIWPITFSILLTHTIVTLRQCSPNRIKALIVEFLKDPFLCASAGIIVTLAISPLVWHHYYVLSLIPAFWLISKNPTFNELDRFALYALFLSSELLPALIPPLRSGPYQYWMMSTAWIPLWFGLQKVVAQKARAIAIQKPEAPFELPLREAA